MKLTVLERIKLLGILPKETNFLTLKIIRKLENVLGFTEKEIKEYNFKDEIKDDKVFTTWDSKIGQEKEIEIGEKANDVIVEALKKLDKENKITKELFSLCEKFVKE